MFLFHNSTADLPHPAHHDGSQLLPYDDFDYMPESNFDEDDIISVDPPDVNVVDAPVGPLSQRIEDLHLKNAIKLLRPNDNLLPNKKQLSSTLLNECHQEVVAKVDTRMKSSTCCLTTDGWSNINDDPVGHDHKYIAEDIARVIRKYNSTEFAGAVTDNTSTNKKAWTLLLKDIFAATKTKKASNTEATYPIDYSFQEMLEFIVDCRGVFKMFHNHHVVKAQLQELQRTIKSRVLVRPVPTRWGTIQQMCQRLLDSESHLHTTSSERDFIKGTAAQQTERQKVKDIITDNQFVVKLKKALAIMVPLDRLIVKYQSDKVPISEKENARHILLQNVEEGEQICNAVLARRRKIIAGATEDSYQAFSMATSSAASERNFSTMGFIHTKLQNCLNVETVEKLVFIKDNLPSFHEQNLEVDDDYESKAHGCDHFSGTE
ncbi:hypothetical protein BASA60_007997 [Batrachochytrium salamandrivorans]|nr:hypothetical protein BASA60_007997 [Batrachochytrium salamandrivorans]